MSGTTQKLLAVLGCALLVRLVAAVGVQTYLDRQPKRQFLIEGDAGGYWELARRLAHGEPYQIHHPPRRIHRMPGFPLLLAGCMTLAGENLLVARIVLAVVGTIACGMVYLLGKELCDPRTGLVAAGTAAVIPSFVGFSVLILSETTFATLLLVSLWSMARLVRTAMSSPAPRHSAHADTSVGEPNSGGQPKATAARMSLQALAVGAAIALACYVRPSWLLAGPLFAAALVLSGRAQRATWVAAALILVGLFLTLSPWIVRNYRVTGGRIVVTTLWLGPSLYDGLNPGATGDSDMTFFDREKLMSRMSEYDVNRYYTRKALHFALQHPGRALELAVIKWIRFWKPWPNAEPFRSWPLRLAVAVFFLPLLVFAAIGWWRCRRCAWTWLLSLGPIIYFALLHMIFVGSLRYRLPAEYPLCVLAAVGVRSWWKGARVWCTGHGTGQRGLDLSPP